MNDRGGLTPEETRYVTQRLQNHAAKLHSIAANHPPKGPNQMAIPADLAAVLAQISTDTDAVAATVKSLDALISTSMTVDDVATVKSTLAAIATRLEATANDPNVPVPVTPPPAPVPAP